MIEPDYVKIKEIKPVLTGYIREAQALLRRSPVPDEEAIHDIRVLMKRSRAVMRLIVNQVEKQTFEREYVTYREVGRLMCSWREDSVHRKTLKYLKKKKPALFTLLKDNEKINSLMKKTAALPEPAKDIENNIETIESLLEKSGYRLRFMNLDKLDPKAILEQLEKSYNIVIDKYMAARNSIKPCNLHMFRKKSKDFLYQLFFFRSLNPTTVKSLEKKLDTLTQNLGKYNDLAQLVQTIGYKYSGKNNTHALDQLILTVREEQDKYLSRVWPMAYKIFSPGKNLINLLGFRVLIIR
jgi:CHAD domain-containing protein